MSLAVSNRLLNPASEEPGPPRCRTLAQPSLAMQTFTGQV